MPTGDVNFTKLLTDIIQKQIVIFGPDIVFSRVKAVGIVTIDNTGVVKKIEGDPKVFFKRFLQEIMVLSSKSVRKTVEPLISQNTELLTILSALSNTENGGMVIPRISPEKLFQTT